MFLYDPDEDNDDDDDKDNDVYQFIHAREEVGM